MRKPHIRPLVWLVLAVPITLVLAGLGYFYANSSSDLSKNKYVFYDKALTAYIGAYAPYAFMDKGGTLDGYVMDLTYAVSRVMGVRIVLVSRRLNDPRSLAEQHDAEVVLCMVKTPATAKSYMFTKPYATHTFSVFARKGTPLPKLENFNAVLSDPEWVVNTDGVYYDLHRGEGHVAAKLVGTAEEALHQVARGGSRYAIMETYVGNKIIEEQALDAVAQLKETDVSVAYSFAVRKGNNEAFQVFSEGLAYLKASGQLKKIQNKWLERRFLLTQRTLDSLVLYALAALLFLMACAMVAGLWSYALKRQVRERTRALEQEARERLRAEEDLSRSREQLMRADKLAVIGTLASGVAHEINNPNGLLLLNLNFLREALRDLRPALEERYAREGDFQLGGLPWSRLRTTLHQLLDDSVIASERIRAIVNDLRLFAAKDNSEEKALFDLNETVARVMRLTDAAVKKATDFCSVEFAREMPPVYGSERKIEQVIINIVLNACQALASKEQRLRVSTFYDADAAMAVLQVCDGGRGIPIEDLPFLCDPFFTTKRHEGGTGLGLSVSASIVESHGGAMTFVSELGRGTTVELLLPPAFDQTLSK